MYRSRQFFPQDFVNQALAGKTVNIRKDIGHDQYRKMAFPSFTGAGMAGMLM